MQGKDIVKQERFQLQHIQVEDLYKLSLPSSATYIICWLQQIPVAHYWYLPASHKTISSLHQGVVSALFPVFQQYHVKLGLYFEKQYLKEETIYATTHKLLEAIEMNNQPPEIAPAVSVVVCTRNRAVHLRACLDHLTKAVRKGDEIIVVDNAPSDNSTFSVVAGYSEVKYVLEAKPGLDRARNAGAKYATNEILAYTDDDVKVPENWVDCVRTAFNDPMTMAVTGIVLPAELETTSQIIFELDWGFNKGYLPVLYDHQYFLAHQQHSPPVWDIGAGANMAFRKRIFELVGLFDERLDVGASGCSGDSEFWFRILEAGWNCSYQPNWYVFHVHRNQLDGLKSQLFYYMRGHISALMAQEQHSPGTGNLRRIWIDMPLYYWKRYYKRFIYSSARDNRFLLDEIRGCISGWRYFKKHESELTKYIRCLPNIPALKKSGMGDCKISVVIPCYNQGAFLQEAIKSIQEQTHTNWEIIVVDDGSTDTTKDVSLAYQDLVKYRYTERVGVSAARNIGAAHATGDFILFLDADDYLLEHAMEINLYFSFMIRP